MKIKKNKFLFFSVVLFAFSLLLFVLVILLNQSLILDKKEIPTILEVGKIAAFNLDNSTFSFGTITPGTTSSRSFEIENNYPFTIVAHLSLKGNISKFLIFENGIKLLPQEKKIVAITTISPTEEDGGHYSGKITVVLRREM